MTTRKRTGAKSRSSTGVKIFSVDRDLVVDALVATGRTTYQYALQNLVPLISRLDIQRNIQNPKFYERLKRDLLKGCVMPPITLAFVRKSRSGVQTIESFSSYVNEKIEAGFVLDGIQRLSTLKRAYDEHPEIAELDQPLFLNILICGSTDNLLYRMITLNNGQKPMSTRHQIEILTANTFKTEGDSIVLATEKGGVRSRHGVFPKSEFVLAYMAFLSNSINVDSQKLIQEKLDDLVANRILEHEPSPDSLEFTQVMKLIEQLTSKKEVNDWFRVSNNLIGFCAGVRDGYSSVEGMNAQRFWEFVQNIENAFRSFDVSKLKVGRARRAVIAYCIRNAASVSKQSTADLTEQLIGVVEA